MKEDILLLSEYMEWLMFACTFLTFQRRSITTQDITNTTNMVTALNTFTEYRHWLNK